MVYIYSALFYSLLCVNYFSIGLCCMATPNQSAVSATATTKRRTTTAATTTASAATAATTAAAVADAIVANTAAATTAATIAATTVSSSQAQCVQTCLSLGCATGVFVPKDNFANTAVPNCAPPIGTPPTCNPNDQMSVCPSGCTCTVCRGNTPCQGATRDASNQDAVNYCQSIGCFSGDCDGGVINCLACNPPTTPKTRAASDAANAACANKCVANGCSTGFINTFVEPGTEAFAVPIGCTCVVCPANTPCSNVGTVTAFCRAIGCTTGGNDPTNSANTNCNNANNACDFGVSACFSCPT